MIRLKRVRREDGGLEVEFNIMYGISVNLLKEIHAKIQDKIESRSGHYDDVYKNVLKNLMNDEDLEIVGLYWFVQLLIVNFVRLNYPEYDKLEGEEWQKKVIEVLSNMENWERVVNFGIHCFLELMMQLTDREWNWDKFESNIGEEA